MVDTAFTETEIAPPILPSLQERANEILPVMREQFRRAADREDTYRMAALDDLRFRSGEQWSPLEKKRRADAGRPCLTINTTPQYERQILNEQRQNRPSIKVRPVGNGADKQTAKVLQGLVRHVEQRSHADYAYDSAFEGAVRCGRGYFRLRLAYFDPLSFEQEILIERIRNAFMVYMDYACQSPTYADARWGFIFAHEPTEVHKAQYGLSGSDIANWAGQGDSWVFSDDVRVAEYFYKEQERYTLARMQDGQSQLLEPMLLGVADTLTDPEPVERFVQDFLTPIRGARPLVSLRQRLTQAEPHLSALGEQFQQWYMANVRDLLGQIVDVRPTFQERIWHLKTNGHLILEESLWPGKWIPIIPVLGDEMDIDNQVMLSGYLRHAKDPMRMKNYWVTMQAEHVALSPVPPWLVAEGQIEDHEDDWKVANREPRAFLTYRPQDSSGQQVPPPIRNTFEPPIQAITLAMQGSEHDVQATIGMYPPSLGQQSRETSGKAILARDQQADTGTYHYGDNLRRAIEFCGEQLVDLLPKVLPPQTVQRILGDDGSTQMVALQPGAEPGAEVPPELQGGIEGIYDIWNGTYDVEVDVGPSYATKRQEAVDTMMELSRSNKLVAELGSDLIVSNIDAQGMEELAARLKKTLPPNLLEEPSAKPEQQVMQLQAKGQEQEQQLKALNAYGQQQDAHMQQLQQENAELKQQFALKSRELDLKERELTLKTALEQEKINIQGDKVDLQALAMQVQAIEARLAAQTPSGA